MIAGRLAGSLAQSERSINKSYNSLQKQKPVLCAGLMGDLQCRVLFLGVSSSPVSCAEVGLGAQGTPFSGCGYGLEVRIEKEAASLCQPLRMEG